MRGEMRVIGRNTELGEERTKNLSTQFECHEPFIFPFQNRSKDWDQVIPVRKSKVGAYYILFS